MLIQSAGMPPRSTRRQGQTQTSWVLLGESSDRRFSPLALLFSLRQNLNHCLEGPDIIGEQAFVDR